MCSSLLPQQKRLARNGQCRIKTGSLPQDSCSRYRIPGHPAQRQRPPRERPSRGTASRRGLEGREFFLYVRRRFGVGDQLKVLSIGLPGTGVVLELGIDIAKIQISNGTGWVNSCCLLQPSDSHLITALHVRSVASIVCEFCVCWIDL